MHSCRDVFYMTASQSCMVLFIVIIITIVFIVIIIIVWCYL